MGVVPPVISRLAVPFAIRPAMSLTFVRSIHVASRVSTVSRAVQSILLFIFVREPTTVVSFTCATIASSC